ncbi:hypothetical protein IWQ47_004724 [Aquimarina sp. EL_43]|uniref:hypothetical protein n=1 Tax=unclassified Aquimarina TaxID=2627091 RepID=UPI0018CB6495|nr:MULTISPECIES: hypothetical protein [unclassified Aquimarina]MBG6133349.1 hypothetical protein [Aquimarina sp. EL_35]MBG6153472.1 hypothetical protein [Aquimarina sp. EL_32]MBG6171628.1 hypothetical protein [Aquimarina sp. EL_43]
MIDQITFLNDNWILQIGIGGIILWTVFIWKEWPEFGKRRFWIKITISFLAITSLAIIALKPAISTANTITTKMVLLTEGYDKEQLDSLARIHKKLKKHLYKANHPIFDGVDTPDSVFVLGYGVKPYDLWKLDNYNVSYLGRKTPSGVIRFKYDYKNTVGKRQVFTGLYANPQKGNRLILEGPGGAGLDSVSLLVGEQQKFEFTTNLNVKGNYLFSLVEKDTLGKILSTDPIPLIVEDSTPLKIVVINGFPTFETKYLKNYLAEMGHQVLVRSQITKGRYKFEYFNMERIPMGAFSKKNLEPFDLVIIDANSFKNLGRASRIALENSVKENGLGIFIQPDSNFFRASNGLGAFNFVSEKNTETRLDSETKIKLSKHAFVFKDEFLLQHIHTKPNTKIISGYKHLGKGRIGTTVLENTYELVLDGHTTAYQHIWSKLITSLSRKETSPVEWEATSIIAYKDHPFTFEVRTSIPKPIVKTSKKHSISMRSDIDIANLWKGVIYPRDFGWNTQFIEQDTTKVFEYFAADTSHWRSQMLYKTIEENKRRYKKSLKNEIIQNHTIRPIPLLGFYLLFLLCAGYLWLEPKLLKP